MTKFIIPQLLDSLIAALKPFANTDIQQQSWLEGRHGTFSSYEEAVCILIDDLDVEALLPQIESASGRILDRTRQFIDALSNVDDNSFSDESGFVNPKLLMESNDWKIVCMKAPLAIHELILIKNHFERE